MIYYVDYKSSFFSIKKKKEKGKNILKVIIEVRACNETLSKNIYKRIFSHAEERQHDYFRAALPNDLLLSSSFYRLRGRALVTHVVSCDRKSALACSRACKLKRLFFFFYLSFLQTQSETIPFHHSRNDRHWCFFFWTGRLQLQSYLVISIVVRLLDLSN